MNRTPELEAFLRAFREKTGISKDFMESCDHPYSCRCGLCLDYWRKIGPDEDGSYGPFTKEEIEHG